MKTMKFILACVLLLSPLLCQAQKLIQQVQ